MPQSRGLQRVRHDLVTEQHREGFALKRTGLMGAGGREAGLAEGQDGKWVEKIED